MIYLYMSIIVYLKVFRCHNYNTDFGLIRIPNVCYTLPAAIMFQVTLVGRVWNCLVYISQMHRMHGIFAYIKDEKWPHEHAKDGWVNISVTWMFEMQLAWWTRFCPCQAWCPTWAQCRSVLSRKALKVEIWCWSILVFPKIGVLQYGWFIMENLIKMDDLGVPLFSETLISRSLVQLPKMETFVHVPFSRDSWLFFQGKVFQASMFRWVMLIFSETHRQQRRPVQVRHLPWTRLLGPKKKRS